MTVLKFVAAATFLAAGSVSAIAQDIVIQDEANQVTIRGGVGVLAIEGREYVFRDTGSPDYLSLLIWQSTAPLLTASLDVKLPSNWTFGAAANVALSGNSYMEDYDWLVPQPGRPNMENWSHQSKHDNTNLEWYFNGSMQVGYNVHQDKDVGNTVNINAGVEYTDVQWTASDGSFIYSGLGGFRNIEGTFTGRGITYRQQLPSLFAGLNGTFERDKWTFNLGAKAGITFSAKATDDHWMRNLRFVENVDAAPLLGLSAGAEYEVRQGLNLFISGKVEKVFLGRSDTEITNISTGTFRAGTTDASGADLATGVMKVGLKGNF